MRESRSVFAWGLGCVEKRAGVAMGHSKLLREINIDYGDGFIGSYISQCILKICVLHFMFIIPQQRCYLNEGSCKDLAWKWVNGQEAGAGQEMLGYFRASRQDKRPSTEERLRVHISGESDWLRWWRPTPTLAVPSSPLWGADTWNEPSFKTAHSLGKDNSPKVNWRRYLARKCIQESKKKTKQNTTTSKSHSVYDFEDFVVVVLNVYISVPCEVISSENLFTISTCYF